MKLLKMNELKYRLIILIILSLFLFSALFWPLDSYDNKKVIFIKGSHVIKPVGVQGLWAF